MPQNTAPIYPLTPTSSTDQSTGRSQLITAAAADYTGVSANYVQVYKAGANGAVLRGLRFKAGGSNIATVARIYSNRAATHTTAANNAFIGEQALPATTASNTGPTPTIVYPGPIYLGANEELWVGLATAVAAGWVVTVEGGAGGDY